MIIYKSAHAKRVRLVNNELFFENQTETHVNLKEWKHTQGYRKISDNKSKK